MSKSIKEAWESLMGKTPSRAEEEQMEHYAKYQADLERQKALLDLARTSAAPTPGIGVAGSAGFGGLTAAGSTTHWLGGGAASAGSGITWGPTPTVLSGSLYATPSKANVSQQIVRDMCAKSRDFDEAFRRALDLGAIDRDPYHDLFEMDYPMWMSLQRLFEETQGNVIAEDDGYSAETDEAAASRPPPESSPEYCDWMLRRMKGEV